LWRTGAYPWIRPSELLSQVPLFCLYTACHPDPERQSASALADVLGVRKWNDASHLPREIQKFVLSRPDATSRNNCSYAFTALSSLTTQCEPTCPQWIRAILGQMIFPVTFPDSTARFCLPAETFYVPNSVSLNGYLKGKVPLLDFQGQDIYKLIPLFSAGGLSMCNISLFEDNEYTHIEGNQIPFDDAHHVLFEAKRFIARCKPPL
jgi:hypothetical protein